MKINNCSESFPFLLFTVSLILYFCYYSSCRRVSLDFTTMTSCATAGLYSFVELPLLFWEKLSFTSRFVLGQIVYSNQFWRILQRQMEGTHFFFDTSSPSWSFNWTSILLPALLMMMLKRSSSLFQIWLVKRATRVATWKRYFIILWGNSIM